MIAHFMQANDGCGNIRTGYLKLLGPRHREPWNGESSHERVRVVAPRNFSEAEVERYIEAIYNYSCYHEHDCCGCLQSSAYGFRRTTKRREYTFFLHQYRNI